MELQGGIKKVYITDQSSVDDTYSQNYITDEEIVTTSAKEVYFLWLSRLVILCAIISFGFLLCWSLVVFRLAPEIVVEPLLIIGQHDSDGVVRYEPMGKNMPSERQLTEMFLKQYVIMRNTVVNDEQEMRTRWGPGGIVAYLSARDVYRDFVGMNAASVEKMFDNDYSSEVRIDSIGKVTEDGPAWAINFTTYNLSRSRASNGALTLKTKKYKATVTPRFVENRRFISPRLINPVGFTVIKYSQDEIRE
ncbi:type IV secretion system protein [bacterium]|nr:type IV secretion system protein [bacterium]MBR1399146.1 type IV secretion system protein [Alphaproteobacteria bacterium]